VRPHHPPRGVDVTRDGGRVAVEVHAERVERVASLGDDVVEELALLAALGPSPDEQFDLGLTFLLNGIAARLSARD
jgi:hypothetical protein